MSAVWPAWRKNEASELEFNRGQVWGELNRDVYED